MEYLLRKPAFDVLRGRIGETGCARSSTSGSGRRGRLLPGEPELPGDIDVAIHSAATVSFDPPIDEGFQTNLFGARNLYRGAIARRRPHLVHVSTAYVAGVRRA